MTPVAAATACLLSVLAMAGCQGADGESAAIARTKAAEASAGGGQRSAKPGQREMYLPLLRKYHDRLTWPQGRDLSPEKLWDEVAPYVGDILLDDTSAEGDVAIVNQCAWALAAIELVKANKDTSEVRKGLTQATQQDADGGTLFRQMADEIQLGNLESTQRFVTANTCDDAFR